jgi:hypothetical protein
VKDKNMSTVEQYRAIFIQQRLYNYVSIVAAIAIVGAVICMQLPCWEHASERIH